MNDDYANLDYYRQKHSSENYGDTSLKYLRFLRPEIRDLGPKSILDYGCGQSRLINVLAESLNVETARYDPAIPEYSTLPERRFDLAYCIDVLEHIEHTEIDRFLESIAAKADEFIIVIDTAPAQQLLDDGRNAHVSLQRHDWWQAKLEQHFGKVYPISTPRSTRAGFRTYARRSEATFRLNRVLETVRHYIKR